MTLQDIERANDLREALQKLGAFRAEFSARRSPYNISVCVTDSGSVEAEVCLPLDIGTPLADRIETWIVEELDKLGVEVPE